MLDRLQHRLGLQTIPAVFFTSAILAAGFITVAVLFDEPVGAFFGGMAGWITTHLGWFFILTVTSALIFLIWLALSRYGNIRLGPDEARPDYGNFTWFTMLFAAGIGTILMFWGVAEPISHFADPPLNDIEAGTTDAASLAMSITLYHFGLHTWTIFALPGLAIAYFSYRHRLPMRISSIFYPLLKERTFGPWGWAIDVVAVMGTLFGVATSLGLGTLQLNSGLNYLFNVPVAPLSQVIIVGVITAIATISVALGLDRGIRRLSQINIVLAIGLLLFVWVAGPTLFITEGMVETLGSYFTALPWLAFWNEAFQGTDWQRSWTVFYWAWTISWAPYVGIFIARISRGRTIREFVGGVLLAPTLFSVLWFSVFGLSAINLELERGVDLASQVEADVSVALFSFLEQFPLAGIMSALGVIIVVVFFTTSSDSASLVIDMLTRRDDQPSLIRQRVFWALAEGCIAGALLVGGGFLALQNVITSLGFPFCALLGFMILAMLWGVQADYRGDPLYGEASQRNGDQMRAGSVAPAGQDKSGEN